jgi:hypothetical protein
MRCERYWSDGVLLIERGLPDPHRDSCLDCRREHEARGQIVRAFQLVGGRSEDTQWQARVWRRIAALKERRPAPAKPNPWMTWVPLATALAAAGTLTVRVVPWSGGVVANRDVRPRIEIVPSEVAMRSTSHVIGDRVRMWVGPAQEARIYRTEELVLRCTEATAGATPGCTRDGGGLVVEYRLELPGDYQLVIAPAGIAEPGGGMDRDLAAIAAARGTYELHSFAVR